MTVIRRRMANPLDPGPIAYAPPDLRVPEERGARFAVLHSQTYQAPPENLDALIRRIAGLHEIDRIIHELESIRDLLRNEGERVSRELASYNSLGQSSVAAMKRFSDKMRND